MEQRKYSEIVRLGHPSTVGVLTVGDNITVQEKLDGASAGIRKIDGELVAYSRNSVLNEELTLRGFYQYVKSLDSYLFLEGYIYYGEWLCSHTISYGEHANKFYMFDLFDVERDCYCDSVIAQNVAKTLNLLFVPVFYEGKYVSFDHLMSFVGKSAFTERGEGIVVKNVDYRSPRSGEQKYVKLVNEEFAESKSQKPPKDPTAYNINPFVAQFLTPARVEKFVYKLVDEEVIPYNFGIELMGTILKELGGRLYDDLLKEESDNLSEEDSNEKYIKKSIGKVLPLLTKAVVLENQKRYVQV